MEWDLIDLSPRCPEARLTVCYLIVRCNLNDKPCLLETDGDCPTYEDWLFEERQEELDHLGESITTVFVPTWLQEFEKEAGYEPKGLGYMDSETYRD